MLGQRRFGKLQTALLVIIALVIGANLVSPAVGHVTKKLKHLYKHLDPRYVNVGEKAADADKLDGKDSSELASRVASGFVAEPTESAGDFLMASATITAPASGQLVMDGIVGLFVSGTTNDTGSCYLTLDGADIIGAEYPYTLDSVESHQEPCVSHSVQQVSAGSHTVTFRISGWVTTSDMDDARVTAVWVPA